MKALPQCRPLLLPGGLRRLAAALALSALLASCGAAGYAVAAAAGGIHFRCPPGMIDTIASEMDAYLASLGIGPALLARPERRSAGTLVYTLRSGPDDGDTLGLHQRAELSVADEVLLLPAPRGKLRELRTVSKKEIVLALLQRGRVTEFAGGHCTVAALRDHVAVRQNTVAWAEQLSWGWPDGESARWNRKYWRNGTPRDGFPLHDAVNDAFLRQEKYSLGCYTAAKLVMLQGVLDYYRRVKKDPRQLQRIEARLLADREPLVNVEPGRMWDFEADFDRRELDRPGKILRIQYGVAARNFVPGDWVYIRNTDAVSQRKTGYEGSNAIYLGRNRFSDYYNDHAHAYSYREKLDEVFQWRHGVFNRQRDADRVRPLSGREIERLGATPAQGGLVADLRVFPYFFGREELPAL